MASRILRLEVIIDKLCIRLLVNKTSYIIINQKKQNSIMVTKVHIKTFKYTDFFID